MGRFTSSFVILLFFLFSTSALCEVVTQPLLEKMEETGADEFIRVNVIMKEQANPLFLMNLVRGEKISERRTIVINYLKEIRDRSQQRILSYLKVMENKGKAERIRSLWLGNAVCFKATKDVIEEIAEYTGVKSIDWDEERILIHPQNTVPVEPKGREIVWNVTLVRAPEVWALGYEGTGIIVSLIDTGVRYTHWDLADHIWTNAGEIPNNNIDDDGNGYIDDYYGYDFYNDDGDPMDDMSHGTHCAGTVASDGTAGSQCGVAPDARIMSLKVLSSAGGGNESDVWESMQYSIDNGAQVISMSLGWQHAWGPNRQQWRNMCNAVLAGGIIMSVAAGNEGDEQGTYPIPDNVRTPGDVPPPWLHPDQALIGGLSAVVTVGATNSSDVIANFSSRGPVTWESINPWFDYPYNPEMGLIDPDVCAPGVNIKSLSYSGDNLYASGWNGTSMATPHVAGAIALMLEKNPNITQAFIDSVLEVTAVELGNPGKDNTYGSGRIDCYEAVDKTPTLGSPDAPTLISPFDFARLPDTQPLLQFFSNDPQNENIEYRVFWDTDTSFASPDSSTTPLYPSGSTVDFTIPSPLTDDETYWWRVKCTDPGGSGAWSQFSERRSFTIGTSLPPNTWTWYQTTGEQFVSCNLNAVIIDGDSLLLGSSSTTLLTEGFESVTFPPTNWVRFAGPGNGSSEDWQRQTNQSHSGSASAGIEYDGSNTVDRFLATSQLDLSQVSNTQLEFWHRDNWASYYNYHGVWASSASQTNPGDYSEVVETGPTAEDSWEVYNVDLSAYDGQASVYVAFRYNELDGTDWWVDDISITGNLDADSGFAVSPPIAFVDFPNRRGWDKAQWTQATGNDSIKIQIEFLNSGVWLLVPDIDLPGNSTGFYTTLQTGEVDLSGMDTTTYDTLRISSTFIKNSSKSPAYPSLLDWEVGVVTSSDIVPPLPFSLLSPPDSTIFANPRPTFIWESTVDAGSGLKNYRVYIQGILRYTGIDTMWTADYDLDEGYNDWYVVACDSANNFRYSNETWTVIIDTTPPSVVDLISPSDNGYLNNSMINFTWHEAYDNVSGVDHYVLQYALNSSFTQGLVETTLVDTVCTVTLPDTIYYWHVRAVDVASNEGSYSSTWQFEVDTQVPAAPVLNSPIGGVWLNNTSINFDWSTVFFTAGKDNNKFLDSKEPESTPFSTPVCYILQVDTTTSFTSPMVVDTYTTNSATISLNEDIYYWRVMAYDLAGNQGPFASHESFGVDTTPPSTVTLISPANNIFLNNSTVNFIWHEAYDNVSGVDHYVLQYALNSSFTQGLVETTLVDTVCTVTLPDTIYYWHVRAVDVASNEGLYSSTWQFEVDTQTPSTPALVSPVGGIWITNTQVDFQWTAVTFEGGGETPELSSANMLNKTKRSTSRSEGSKNPFTDGIEQPERTPLSPVHYVIQVDTTTGFTSPVYVDTFTTTSTSVTLNEDIYYWRVRAYDMAGNQSPFSAYESFGVDITAPVIESTTVWTDTTYIGPFEIRTKVTDNLAGLDSVLLYYKRDEDPDWVIEVMHQSGDWFTDTIPAVTNSNDTVRYYIRAIDYATNESTDPTGAPASYYSFIANLLGIVESSETPFKFNFKVNSLVKGKAIFRFAIPKRSRITLKIYDATGRIISGPLSGSYHSGIYQVSFKPARAGIYFYRLESSYTNRTGKLVIF